MPEEGHSPYVWSVLGGIAGGTGRLRIGTGVTAPLIRMHPAIVAQAAATAAVMLDGRFFLGVGTSERLNEHITGLHWPRPDVRREMLEEAVASSAGSGTADRSITGGAHYTVERAELFTRPTQPPPDVDAGSSTKGATLAGRIGDGFFGVIPSNHTRRGVRRRRRCREATPGPSTCAGRTARSWPGRRSAGGGPRRPQGHGPHRAGPSQGLVQVLILARIDAMVEAVALGPDPKRHLDLIASFAEAGFNQILVDQIGPDHDGFLRFYGKKVMSAVRGEPP